MLVSRLMSGPAPRKGPSGTAGASIEAFRAASCALARHSRLFTTCDPPDTPATTSTECGGVEDGAGGSVQGGCGEAGLPAVGAGARGGRMAVAPAHAYGGRAAGARHGRVRRADPARRGGARGGRRGDEEVEPGERRHRQGDHGEDQGRDRRREPLTRARERRSGAKPVGGVPTWLRARLALTAPAPTTDRGLRLGRRRADGPARAARRAPARGLRLPR